jgi:hypothetical protein
MHQRSLTFECADRSILRWQFGARGYVHFGEHTHVGRSSQEGTEQMIKPLQVIPRRRVEPIWIRRDHTRKQHATVGECVLKRRTKGMGARI